MASAPPDSGESSSRNRDEKKWQCASLSMRQPMTGDPALKCDYMQVLVGLIADTHGLVRPGVFPALDGVELILHAGDVGDGVVGELETIAPVRAVYGNTDPPGQPGLAADLGLRIEALTIHVSHG